MAPYPSRGNASALCSPAAMSICNGCPGSRTETSRSAPSAGSAHLGDIGHALQAPDQLRQLLQIAHSEPEGHPRDAVLIRQGVHALDAQVFLGHHVRDVAHQAATIV